MRDACVSASTTLRLQPGQQRRRRRGSRPGRRLLDQTFDWGRDHSRWRRETITPTTSHTNQHTPTDTQRRCFMTLRSQLVVQRLPVALRQRAVFARPSAGRCWVRPRAGGQPGHGQNHKGAATKADREHAKAPRSGRRRCAINQKSFRSQLTRADRRRPKRSRRRSASAGQRLRPARRDFKSPHNTSPPS